MKITVSVKKTPGEVEYVKGYVNDIALSCSFAFGLGGGLGLVHGFGH